MKQFALRSGKQRAEVGRKGEDCSLSSMPYDFDYD